MNEAVVLFENLEPYLRRAEQISENVTWPLLLNLISNDLQSKTQTIAAQDRTMAAQDRTMAALEQGTLKDQTIIDLLNEQKSALTEELVRIQAKSQAVMANRIVLETALTHFAVVEKFGSKSFTGRFEHFRDTFMLGSGGKKLNSESEAFLNDLVKTGLVASKGSVETELENLLHNVSTPHHYLTGAGIHRSGIYIGGEQPRCAALALCMLHLQKRGHSDLELFVVDEKSDVKCQLLMGVIK
jgi:hypothetical protein